MACQKRRARWSVVRRFHIAGQARRGTSERRGNGMSGDATIVLADAVVIQHCPTERRTKVMATALGRQRDHQRQPAERRPWETTYRGHFRREPIMATETSKPPIKRFDEWTVRLYCAGGAVLVISQVLAATGAVIWPHLKPHVLSFGAFLLSLAVLGLYCGLRWTRYTSTSYYTAFFLAANVLATSLIASRTMIGSHVPEATSPWDTAIASNHPTVLQAA